MWSGKGQGCALQLLLEECLLSLFGHLGPALGPSEPQGENQQLREQCVLGWQSPPCPPTLRRRARSRNTWLFPSRSGHSTAGISLTLL